MFCSVCVGNTCTIVKNVKDVWQTFYGVLHLAEKLSKHFFFFVENYLMFGKLNEYFRIGFSLGFLAYTCVPIISAL